MNDGGILGAALGQLGQTVKQGAKQVVRLPEEMAQDVGGQVKGTKPTEEKSAENKPQQQWQSDEERIKFLKDLYGKKDMPQDESLNSNKNANPNPPAHSASSGSRTGGKPSEFEKQIADKSPDEQKKLLELRRDLHKQVYYEPTFNPVKKQEERPAEKVESEKKKEMIDLQKKEEKKPPPLAVVRERNKAEMFRGASG